MHIKGRRVARAPAAPPALQQRGSAALLQGRRAWLQAHSSEQGRGQVPTWMPGSFMGLGAASLCVARLCGGSQAVRLLMPPHLLRGMHRSALCQNRLLLARLSMPAVAAHAQA